MTRQDDAVVSRKYEHYRDAIKLLATGRQTVTDRRRAIKIKDAFELEIRDGIFDGIMFDVAVRERV